MKRKGTVSYKTTDALAPRYQTRRIFRFDHLTISINISPQIKVFTSECYTELCYWGVSLLPGVELVERDRVAGVTGGMLLVGGAGVLASGDSGILLFSR